MHRGQWFYLVDSTAAFVSHFPTYIHGSQRVTLPSFLHLLHSCPTTHLHFHLQLILVTKMSAASSSEIANPCPEDLANRECSEIDDDPHMLSPTFYPTISNEQHATYNWHKLPRFLPHPIPESLVIGIFNNIFYSHKYRVVAATRMPSTCSIRYTIRDHGSNVFLGDIYPHNPPGTCSFMRAHILQVCVRQLYNCQRLSKGRYILTYANPSYHITILPKLSLPTIDSLINLLRGGFPKPVVFKVSVAILRVIERVHFAQCVHGNLSPKCLLVRRDHHGRIFAIIEGFHHLEPIDDRPRRKHQKHFCTGRCDNHLYSSVEVQNRDNSSVKDDLQSFIYIVIFMVKGRLPWKNASWKRMAEMKLDLSSGGAFDGVPKIFKDLFSRV